MLARLQPHYWHVLKRIAAGSASSSCTLPTTTTLYSGGLDLPYDMQRLLHDENPRVKSAGMPAHKDLRSRYYDYVSVDVAMGSSLI